MCQVHFLSSICITWVSQCQSLLIAVPMLSQSRHVMKLWRSSLICTHFWCWSLKVLNVASGNEAIDYLNSSRSWFLTLTKLCCLAYLDTLYTGVILATMVLILITHMTPHLPSTSPTLKVVNNVLANEWLVLTLTLLIRTFTVHSWLLYTKRMVVGG